MLHRLICLMLVCSFIQPAMALNLPQAATIQVPEDVLNELLSNEEASNEANPELSAVETQTAQDSNEEPVTTQTLKIVGRGLENRKTHDVISLACIGQPTVEGSIEPSCKTLRHVKYKAATGELVYLGKSYQFDHEPTEKDLQNQVKSINKGYRKYKGMNLYYEGIGFGVTFAAGVFLPVLTSAIIGSVYVVGLITRSVNPFQKVGVVSQSMADQNGWNWSNQPRKISNRTYSWVERYLASQE